MFAQIIRAKTSDPKALRASLDKWMKDLEPGAKGYLGTTSGVTEQGDVFALVRFESEDAAKANSDRPEQGEWWAEFEKNLDGEATFQDSSEVYVDERGDLDSAGFVQIMIGASSDPERTMALMAENRDARVALRPDILGQVAVAHGGGKFTLALYFTSEAEAREGEAKPYPPELEGSLKEVRSLGVGDPEYLNLRTPWLDSPRSS